MFSAEKGVPGSLIESGVLVKTTVFSALSVSVNLLSPVPFLGFHIVFSYIMILSNMRLEIILKDVYRKILTGAGDVIILSYGGMR